MQAKINIEAVISFAEFRVDNSLWSSVNTQGLQPRNALQRRGNTAGYDWREISVQALLGAMSSTLVEIKGWAVPAQARLGIGSRSSRRCYGCDA